MQNKRRNIDTLSVHAGRQDFHQIGVHAPPIDFSSTYPIPSLGEGIESIDSLAGGSATAANPIYSRLFNPTVRRFEEGLAQLEGAEDAVAFSSGMAAFTATLLGLAGAGGHVVAVRPLYGGSDHLLAGGLLGTEVTWAEPGRIAEACEPRTALVILETPANPTLRLTDLRAACAAIKKVGDIPILVDSTFATPILQRPLELGADLVLHSATKFLGGHGDVLAGVIATSSEFATTLRQVRLATGANLHPMGAYLLHRGLPTLPIRVRQAQANAQSLVNRMMHHPMIEKVWYPGLEHCDPHGLVGTQMSGPGSLIAIEVRGGEQTAAKVMNEVRIMTPAVSLGSVDTLIQHPAGLTHRVVDPEARRQAGITEGLLRISVGLEDPQDLWEDLESALDQAMAVPERVEMVLAELK